MAVGFKLVYFCLSPSNLTDGHIGLATVVEQPTMMGFLCNAELSTSVALPLTTVVRKCLRRNKNSVSAKSGTEVGQIQKIPLAQKDLGWQQSQKK